MAVDPREAIASIPLWLRDRFGIQLNFGTPVVHVDHPALTVSDGRSWNADRIVICSGGDFGFLYPDSYQQLSVTRCKLQMMQTGSPAGWVASGPTARRRIDVAALRVIRILPESDGAQ